MPLILIVLRNLFFATLGIGILGAGWIGTQKNSPASANCEEPEVVIDQSALKRYRAQLSNMDTKSQPAPVAVCFAEGTDPGVMNAFYEALEQAQEGAWPESGRYNLNTRWTGGVQGDRRALTWSFVPDGLNIPNGVGEAAGPSTLFASMDAKFGGNRALWISKFQEVFDRWAQVSGLSYTRITTGGNQWDDGAVWGSVGSGTRGDLRISMKNIDGPGGILAYNFFPQSGDMVIDASENWQSTSSDPSSTSFNYRFLRNTLSHEHGHGMGVLHVCPRIGTKLMEPILATAFDGPQQDDIRAAHRHYGDQYEPNNSAAQSQSVGANIGVGTNFTLGNLSGVSSATNLSIDADGEQDYYTFTTLAPLQLSATVTPVGTNYLSGPQTSACDTGTAVNALALADLAIEIRTPAGVVLKSAQGNAVGLAETLLLDMPTPGTYHVRIFETNSPTQAQLYRLNLSGVTRPTNTISGRINFQDWTSDSSALPVAIEVKSLTTQAVLGTFNTTTNALGDYSVSVTGLVQGETYSISADAAIWLRRTVATTAPAGLSITGFNLSLPNGDVDGSGEVDAADIDAVITAFGQTSESFFNADPDGSGEVDAADIDLVIANFGGQDN